MLATTREISIHSHLRFDLLHLFISTVFCLPLEGSKHSSQTRTIDGLYTERRQMLRTQMYAASFGINGLMAENCKLPQNVPY